MNRLRYRYLVLAICLLASYCSNAQTTDTVRADTNRRVITNLTSHKADTSIKKDTANIAKPKFQPNAKKAGLFSAILPGLGQVYDHKYWKVPLIGAGVGTAVYFINYNSTRYHKFRKAYVSRIDNNPNNDELKELYPDPQELKSLQDEYKKWLDLSILLTAVGYTAQVIDAIVYAHLKNFDISRDISMKITPVVNYNYAGLGLVFSIK
jgi:hypothetical protein